MFEPNTRGRVARLLSFCLWSWRTAAYIPVPFRTDQYYGVDGPWQAVTVQVGGWDDDIVDSYQWSSVDMYPGGYYSSYALTSDACDPKFSGNCATDTWDVQGAQTGTGQTISWVPAVDFTSISGFYETGPIYAQNMEMGYGGTTATCPNASISAVYIANQTLPNGKQVNLEVGALALGADDQKQVFTTGSETEGEDAIEAWIFPGYLYNQSLAQSYSYTLHIGSTAFNYPGSMIYGGYDKGRAIGPGTTYADTWPTLLDIELGAITGGSPFDSGTVDGLLMTNTSAQGSVTTNIEALLPGLHLSKDTCDNLAKHLPVKFDQNSGYYLWDTQDPSYRNITSSAAYLGFKYPPATGNTKDVTIKVPFQLLVLNLTEEASGRSGLTPYFPCMPYDSTDGTYFLGRAFLQAAFWGRNFNQHVSWLAQAPGPGTSKTGLGHQPMDIENSNTVLDFYTGDQYLTNSWSGYWTPLEDTTSSSGGSAGNGSSSGGLSTGAKAGIGIGAAAVCVALLAVLAWFLLHRKKKRRESGSAKQPFVASHYAQDSKEEPGPQYQQYQRESALTSPYPASSTTDEAYGSYKHSPHDSIPMHDMSATVNGPSELPGHDPPELEANGPRYPVQPGQAL